MPRCGCCGRCSLSGLEPVGLEGTLGPGGPERIRAVELGGRSHLVRATGRRWRDGEGLHILVMLEGGQVWQLLWRDGQALLERRFGRAPLV